jgi:GAF domain-containing protein
VSSDAAREILVRGARALARSDPGRPGLDDLLAVIAEQLDIESAVIVVADGSGHLAIVASVELEDPAIAGLTEALRNPGHPIARTVADPVPSFDVLPSVPGGPALRSHLPLTVTRDGTSTVLGVLALAHQRPLGPEPRQLLEAAADLAALAVERGRPS